MSAPRGRVLLVDDEPLMRIPLVDRLRAEGYEATGAATATQALALLAQQLFAVTILDLRLPDRDGLAVLREIRDQRIDTAVVLITAFGTIDAAVEAMKLGARDFLQKPFEAAQLLALVDRYARARRAGGQDESAPPLAGEGRFCDLVGAAPPMRHLFRLLDAAAATEATVLVEGETGTGKELVAAAIHARSPRRGGPLVKVNCAALPETLFESELFGHERGAFTGAERRHRGRFEQAQGGTLFLDEVEEIPQPLQVKLLRVVQERELDRLGGSEVVPLDVRLVAATKRNLRALVDEGRFRADLYYRLSVLPLTVPPLRERLDDLPLLVEHFLALLGTEMRRPGRRFSAEALAVLGRHDFPGNVRELRNLVARALALCPGELIAPEHLGPELQASIPAVDEAPLAATVREAEARRIDEALAQAGGRKAAAAELLGISRKTLWEKLRKRDGR